MTSAMFAKRRTRYQPRNLPAVYFRVHAVVIFSAYL